MVGKRSIVAEVSATVPRLESDPDERRERKAQLLDLNMDRLPLSAHNELQIHAVLLHKCFCSGLKQDKKN